MTQKQETCSAESQTPRALHENCNFLAPKIKLPTTETQKFGGQITGFKHFHDTFNSSITNNQAQDDVQ